MGKRKLVVSMSCLNKQFKVAFLLDCEYHYGIRDEDWPSHASPQGVTELAAAGIESDQSRCIARARTNAR